MTEIYQGPWSVVYGDTPKAPKPDVYHSYPTSAVVKAAERSTTPVPSQPTGKAG